MVRGSPNGRVSSGVARTRRRFASMRPCKGIASVNSGNASQFVRVKDLRSSTQGKGTFTMEFARYALVPKQEQEEMTKKYREKLAAEAARK